MSAPVNGSDCHTGALTEEEMPGQTQRPADIRLGLQPRSRWVTVSFTSRAAAGYTSVFPGMHTRSSRRVAAGRVQVFRGGVQRLHSPSLSPRLGGTFQPLVCAFFPAAVARLPGRSAPRSFQKTKLLLHGGYETAPPSSILAPSRYPGFCSEAYRL